MNIIPSQILILASFLAAGLLLIFLGYRAFKKESLNKEAKANAQGISLKPGNYYFERHIARKLLGTGVIFVLAALYGLFRLLFG